MALSVYEVVRVRLVCPDKPRERLRQREKPCKRETSARRVKDHRLARKGSLIPSSITQSGTSTTVKIRL